MTLKPLKLQNADLGTWSALDPSLLCQSCSSLLWIPPQLCQWISHSCSQQLGKNPFNSSFAWFKVAEFGLSSFLGRLGSVPWAEVLSRTWQGLSPPQHCLFGITLGNKLRSYTSFALQQKEGKKFSDKFLNHNPAKIYNKKFICKPLQCTEFKSTPLHNDPCLNTWSQMQKKMNLIDCN